MEAALDFLPGVLDEIALEGLDGITLSTLWVRLNNRPHFPFPIDDDSKAYLWECIAVNGEIQIYELPVPRPTFQLFNRYDYIDLELGIVTEPADPRPDIYPLEAIKDGNVRGSCATYRSRTCITSDIRHDSVLLISLNQALEKWGDTLILVSSPKSRLLSLIGSEANPLLELNIESYCLLERIGRSRFDGEVTQGENGLLALGGIFQNQLHYYRSKLSSKHLITKQKHFLRKRNGQTVTGSLFHLTRFYVERRSKMETLIECMREILIKKTKNREVSKTLRMELGITENTFKKLFQKSIQKWFKLMPIPYNEMYPEASQKENVTSNGQQRFVKVVQLIEPFEDDEEDDGKVNDASFNAYFNPSKLVLDVPLMVQAYKLVESAGPNGITSTEINKAFTFPKLETRMLCNNLVKRKVVISMMQDRGRTRETNFISKKFEMESESCINVKEQRQKLLDHHNNITNITEESNDASINAVGVDSEITNEKMPFDLKLGHVDNEQTYMNSVDNNFSAMSNFHNITTEIIELDKEEPFKNAKTKTASFSEKTKEKNGSTKNLTGHNTLRSLKRGNLMLEYLKRVKLATFEEMKKFVISEEKKEGYNFILSKIPALTLLNKLSKDGHIKIFKAILKLENKVKSFVFICDPSFKLSDPQIINAIDQAKFKNFCVHRDPLKTKGDCKIEASADTKNTSEVISPKALKDAESKCSKPLTTLYGSRVYGLQPKFIRTKTLHLFLFYLVHKYEGMSVKEHSGPFTYHLSDSWKRFIPPLPDYGKKGWCILADVISRMPLSIFIKVVNQKYQIPELEEFLNDKEKQNYLIKYLPQSLRNELLGDRRRYVFRIHDVVRRLCHMGLVTFGPNLLYEKDQVYVFVHQKAKIKDTSITPAGYLYIDSDLDYDTKEYVLKTSDDVECYWIDLQHICLRTALGNYSVVNGQSIAVPEINQKPEMIELLKNKKMEDVIDSGETPGDGLGAAGLDSSLFLHLSRNWRWPNPNYKTPERVPKCDDLSKTSKKTSCMQYLLQQKGTKMNCPESRQRLQRLTNKIPISNQQKTKLNNKSKVSSLKKKSPEIKKKRAKIRTVKLVKKSKRPYYDEKDKAALLNMSKMRSEWTAQEDSFLLLCKVASAFLDLKCKRLVVPFTVVRDLIHERFPELSASKSSRACQRRLRHMLFNPETRSNVAVFLGESRQDAELVKEFDKLKPPKTKEGEWKAMFTSVLNKLLKKLAIPAQDRCKNIILPHDFVSFHNKFNVIIPGSMLTHRCNHNDPQNTADIFFGVVYSLVVSSLATIGDQQNWCFTLYKLYQQYPERLLSSVIDHLHKEQLITKKVNYNRRKLKNIPPSSLPYRFSVTYENAFLTKYPIKIYVEAKELLGKLSGNSTFPKTQLDGDVTSGYTAAVLSLAVMNKLEFETKVPDQIIIFDTSLSQKQRSTIVERMMPTLTDKDSHELVKLLNTGKRLRDDENDENCDRPAKKIKVQNSGSCDTEMKCDPWMKNPLPSSVSETSSFSKLPKTSCKTAVIDDSKHASKTSSTLGMMPTLNDKDSHELVEIRNSGKRLLDDENSGRPTKKIKTENSRICGTDKKCVSLTKEQPSSIRETSSMSMLRSNFNTNSDVGSSKLTLESSTSASRFALYMLRQEFSQPPIDRVQHSQDYIVLNSCQLCCQIKQPPVDSRYDLSLNPKEILEEIPHHSVSKSYPLHKESVLSDSVIQDIVQSQCFYIPIEALTKKNCADLLLDVYEKYSSSPDSLPEAQRIFHFICLSKELGVSHQELLKKFDDLNGDFFLEDHLHLLMKSLMVIRVGIACFRYVCTEYCDKWILSSFIIPKEVQLENSEFIENKQVSPNKEHRMTRDVIVRSDVNDYATVQTGTENIVEKDICDSVKIHSKSLAVQKIQNKNKEISCLDGNMLLQTPKAINAAKEFHANKYSDEMSLEGRCTDHIDDDVEKSLSISSKAIESKQNTSEPNIEVEVYAEEVYVNEVHFIPRTWRKPDGSLNRPMIIKLLATVLSYVISTPGATEQKICERFSLILQPVQTLELLELLEKAHCIFRYYCKPVTKGTLFSSASNVFVTERQSSKNVIHFECFPDAVVKMAKLKDSIIEN